MAAVYLAGGKQSGLTQISKNLLSVCGVCICLFSVMCAHVLGQRTGWLFSIAVHPVQPFTDPREPLSPHTGAVTPVLLISLADWTTTLSDLPIFTGRGSQLYRTMADFLCGCLRSDGRFSCWYSKSSWPLRYLLSLPDSHPH